MLLFSLRVHRQRLWFLGRRSFSSESTLQNSIYVSTSTDPYFNLSCEDWLFRHKAPHEPLLFMYRDDPCVVIGRNQNPWKEVNFEALRARPDVPFIRRRSGGGTVYHDLGNTNFSIHLPRASFDRHVTAQVVLRAVRALGVDALVNDRNDICVGTEKMSSAYKIVNKRAYHHGTMLISTQLDTLGTLLRTTKDTMHTRGVASVRSPVCNLRQFEPKITHQDFTNAVIAEFRHQYQSSDEVCLLNENLTLGVDYIRMGMAELKSWEWAYGQTPEFTYTIDHSFPWGDVTAEITSKHGIINSCKLSASNTHLEKHVLDGLAQLGLAVETRRYAALGDIIARGSSGNPVQEVESWLRAVME